ncbi:Mph(B) family macrolide 2'-phosphotransferase [Anaerobacillus arseniciselenatis]|uniref:Mph(B) family macrolide 2'-phosphotransferase n=1 Tax=Anaerobacillus arseniciselenatis TaxID=85682 RepID=A0A1S2LS70_9BACI|nr:macrolide 2'-phosphotransferase [Anaerobacillus arseniciselenatis]OIJ15174.1 Mph(B) family macrolide 2'-phosphotransferase [Anaerobacillus arseniciselenatis]
MNKKVKEIKEIAKKNGIFIEEDSIKINESGLDFQVVHAVDRDGVQWILRLPRREDSMTKTDVEKKVLHTVNLHVSFEVPVWSVYTDDLIAYKQLSGIPAGTVDPAIQNYIWEIDVNNVPASYLNSLGKVLAELHQVPKESLINIPGFNVQTADEAKVAMKKRMNAVKEKYGVSDALWARWQAWMDNDKMWPTHTGLIHGDVHAGHTLINEQAEVTGLIDWTEVAVTDVSKDFVGPYMVFGEEALEQIIASYEAAGGVTWPLMKEHIIEFQATSAIDIAEFAEASGLQEYEEMAKESLGMEV